MNINIINNRQYISNYTNLYTNIYKIANTMQSILNYNCSFHHKPILFICCVNDCNLPMTVCQLCQNGHAVHQDKLMTLQYFITAIVLAIQKHNAQDVLAMKENDLLNTQIKMLSKSYVDREKQLLNNLMKKLQEQKSQIVKKSKKCQQSANQNILKYFDKMSQKGYINYRILFSSHKGIHNFYSAYKKYCQISDISIHINQSILPNYQYDEQQTNEQTEEQIKKSMAGTLTQNIMNYIKLKISKKDAMRISQAVAISTTSILKPQPVNRVVGLPPPSPPRKIRKVGKTEININ